MSSKYESTARSTSAHVTPGRKRVEGDLLGGAHVLEMTSHLVRRRADDHGALELGVVAPYGCARLAHEDVARPEPDVVRDRVRPRAPLADLAPIARGGSVGRRKPAVVRRAERSEHGEARLVAGAEACLRLGRAGSRVLLQESVRMCAPTGALADELDLGLALARHQLLQSRKPAARSRRRVDLAERRSLVAEDPRVAVLIGADRPGDAHVVEQPSAGSASGAPTPGYSGYPSTRSKLVSAWTRATSNSGTNARGLRPLRSRRTQRAVRSPGTRTASGTGRSSGRTRRTPSAPDRPPEHAAAPAARGARRRRCRSRRRWERR